jgi:dihydrofolate reductase
VTGATAPAAAGTARFRASYGRLLEWVLIVLMVVLAVEVTLGVVFRTAGRAVSWYDEIASVLLAWLTFYGAALASVKRAHIGCPEVVELMPWHARRMMGIGAQILVIAFFLLLGGIGAWILGRNMFGPVRGPWPDESWKGWWGDEPPYHTPVFVLTHHARAPIEMKGGTVFRFVTEGNHAALQQARDAADGRDVRLGGGVSTIRQYLRAGLVDELHLAIAPVLLGAGEHLMNGIDLPALGYECVEHVAGGRAAAHVILRKRA